MTIKELRDLEETALTVLLNETYSKLSDAKLKNAMRQLENTAEIKQLRHKIAQILTILNEIQIKRQKDLKHA
ncbi:MAG: 50S ribosomal protein L29 [Cyanobacteria bacterium P01_H01_bin.74]